MVVDLLIIFKTKELVMEENSCKRNYFIDGKHCMENFNTTDLQRFSWLGKPNIHKKMTVNLIQSSKNSK